MKRNGRRGAKVEAEVGVMKRKNTNIKTRSTKIRKIKKTKRNIKSIDIVQTRLLLQEIDRSITEIKEKGKVNCLTKKRWR